MALPTSGTISAGQIQTEFSLPTASFREFYQSNTDVFSRSGPAYGGLTVSLSDFYGASGRTAIINPGISTTTNFNTPDRYGWSLANYSGFYHAEQGLNTGAFGSISRYSGLIGNSLVAICTHDVGEGSTRENRDTHLEIFTTSSSNSGWTYMDVKIGGDFQYQPAGYIRYTFTRTQASHFGQVGGLDKNNQPTNTVYAWTFTGSVSTFYNTNETHPIDNDNVRSLHSNFKSAYGGNSLATPYIRFR